ncbi:Hypothetical protein Ccan_05880 [Capnocytophaga canimorsus Cc5]|uniref:Uncharacterized protein n=1 Tax=Capnocytophaga canimorsus (strain 5) TaxID=860228 RepID=F9YSN5_CAPCC|nr:Hypothetical protein Ccan_05880 [Capnocytophaga canimorsus Cc5]
MELHFLKIRFDSSFLNVSSISIDERIVFLLHLSSKNNK